MSRPRNSARSKLASFYTYTYTYGGELVQILTKANGTLVDTRIEITYSIEAVNFNRL